MKKFALKTTVGAIAVLAAGLAQAGFLSANLVAYTIPTSPLATTNYAREALAPATVVSTPGVAVQFNSFKVTAGVPYRVILEVNNADFDKAVPVNPDVELFATPGTVVSCVPVTFAGQTDKQLAWECTADVSDNIGLSFNAGTLKVKNTSLVNGGAAVTIKAELQSREGFATYDSVSATSFMAGVQAVTITAPNDTGGTTTDVNYSTGPLNGFVANVGVPADTALAAAARFTVANNLSGAVCADGSTLFDMNLNCGAYVNTNALKLTLKDSRSFQALASASSLTAAALLPLGNFSIAADTATLNITPVPLAFLPFGNSTNVDVTYTASGTSSLGTERTIGFAGKLDGGGQSFDVGNNNWWVWGNNGSILKFPAISYKAGSPSWIQLVNNAGFAVTYQGVCYQSDGTTKVAVPGSTAANSTKRVALTDICDTKTQSIILTLATPQGNVNGSVIRKDGTTGAVSSINASAGNQ